MNLMNLIRECGTPSFEECIQGPVPRNSRVLILYILYHTFEWDGQEVILMTVSRNRPQLAELNTTITTTTPFKCPCYAWSYYYITNRHPFRGNLVLTFEWVFRVFLIKLSSFLSLIRYFFISSFDHFISFLFLFAFISHTDIYVWAVLPICIMKFSDQGTYSTHKHPHKRTHPHTTKSCASDTPTLVYHRFKDLLNICTLYTFEYRQTMSKLHEIKLYTISKYQRSTELM